MSAPEDAGTAHGEHEVSSSMKRADQLVDDLLQRAARMGRRAAALVREEAEDVWAEAKQRRPPQSKE